MTKTIWILIAVGVAIAIGILVYFMFQRPAARSSMADGGDTNTDEAGVVNAIGTGLTSIATSITGFATREDE